jgi:uncharacterized membrane protein
LTEVIDRGALRDVHPPGYAIFLHYSIRLFGDSEVMLRLPACLAGILAVYLMFQLGKLLYSEKVGLYAAALVAVAHLPLYHAQDCRAYSLLLAGAIGQACLMLLIERALRDGDKTVGLWAAYTINGWFVAYLHYFGLLWVTCVGLFLFFRVLRQKRGIRAWLLVHGTLALSYVPWLMSVRTQVRRGDSWMPKPTVHELAKLAYNILDRHPIAWFVLVILGGSIAWWSARRGGKGALDGGADVRQSLWRLGMWILWPLSLALLLSWTVLPVMSARNFIIVVPAAAILLALSLRSLDVRLARGYPVTIVLVVGWMLFEMLFVRRYYATQTKRQFRQSAAYVWHVTQTMDTIPFIATEEVWEEYLSYYWRTQRDKSNGSYDESKVPRVSVVASSLNERLAEEKPEDVILIISLTRSRSTLPRQLAGYHELSTKHFVGIDVKRLRRNRDTQR